MLTPGFKTSNALIDDIPFNWLIRFECKSLCRMIELLWRRLTGLRIIEMWWWEDREGSGKVRKHKWHICSSQGPWAVSWMFRWVLRLLGPRNGQQMAVGWTTGIGSAAVTWSWSVLTTTRSKPSPGGSSTWAGPSSRLLAEPRHCCQALPWWDDVLLHHCRTCFVSPAFTCNNLLSARYC